MELLIAAGIFVLTLLLVYAGRYFLKRIYKPEQQQALKRLRILSMTGQGNAAIDLLKKKILSEIPWLNQKLLDIRFVARIERLHNEARVSRPLGFYVILSFIFFLLGLRLSANMGFNALAMVVLSIFPAVAPFYYLSYKRKKRVEKFERQLPDALELMARALQAGHAFTGGLRMVAEEFGDPVGTEFKQTLDEINFGVGASDALANLTHRIDNEDLKFFAVAVNIQRETGGNLAELLVALGTLIRERFKFQSRVRVLSAEGRMSARVLLAMPFVVVGIFSVTAPENVKALFTDPIGTYILIADLVMMGLGSLAIMKVVAIKA